MEFDLGVFGENKTSKWKWTPGNWKYGAGTQMRCQTKSIDVRDKALKVHTIPGE